MNFTTRSLCLKAVIIMMTVFPICPPQAASQGDTLGFVLIDFDMGFYQSQDVRQDCPDGFLHKNRDNWAAQFPTRDARQRHLNRCAGSTQNRGPNCENVWFAPQLIEDPLPHRDVKSKIAYGMNLDGTGTGAATSTTCAHEKFVSPDGATGVDNQLYRFAGCDNGIRTVSDEQTAKLVVDYVHRRLLLEITGVDDEQNDDAVQVALYQGRDTLRVDSEGKASAIPGQSQRIEPGGLSARLRGSIVDGVLETEPADHLTSLDWFVLGRPFIRGMRLRLKLTASGAEGLQAGYVDLERFWEKYARASSDLNAITGASGPSAYRALHRLADGYKDPHSDACTALSAARNLTFVRAHLIHPPGGVGETVLGQ